MGSDFIDTRQLEAFAAVMTVGSITGAAKRLGKSQPVVTRLIQDLEQDLGFALLRRNGPRIAPTEQGVAFFLQAENFLSGLRTISEKARMIAEGAARPIELAAIPAAAVGIVPQALARLGEAALPGHVHLHSMPSESVVQAVIARTADLGIASLPLDNPGIDIHWIAEVPCVAVVAADDPLASVEAVSAAHLAQRRLIASANPYRLRHRIDAAFERLGVQPPAVLDCNATYVSLALARQGLGVAVVESLTLAGLPLDGVTVRPLAFRLPFHWGLISASGRPPSGATEALIGAVEACARREIAGFQLHAGLSALAEAERS